MILYVNSKGEVKAVNTTEDKSLTELPISENSMNPFANWPIAKICCYRVGVIPEMVTEVVGTEDRIYIDLEGNEVTETVDITETKATGKYIISMMTPYMDSRIVEHISRLGGDTEMVAADLTDTQLALVESYDQTLAIADDLTDTQLALVENYDQTLAISEDLTDTQLALVENYDLSIATAEDVSVAQEEITDIQLALVEIYDLVMGGE